MHMNLYRLAIFSLVFLLCNGIFAQEQTDNLAAVKTSVEHYFQGYIHRDLARLKVAFDTENGTMKLPYQTESGEQGFKNGYFKEIVPKWGNREKLPKEVLAKANLSFLNINVVSAKMAIATIRMEVGEKTYIDVLSLQKMDTQWKITNKMYIEL